MPVVAESGAGANQQVITTECMPSSPIPSSGPFFVDDQHEIAASETEATPPSPTIAAIVELQKQRVFCIKSQSRCDRSCEAFITRYLGYTSPKEKDKDRSGEKARKEMFARAAAMRKAVEKGTEVDGGGHRRVDSQVENALSACTPIIINSAASRLAWDNHRAQVEKHMRKLTKLLSVYEWVAGVSGFGELGLAIVIGETGDLSNYATKERVWKRLGLAVIEGERQQKRANVDQAAVHAYNPRRRAEIWTIADSMFKHQWHGAKDGIEAGPAGPYGEVYAKRKAHTETREWTPKRRDNDARRIMTKALIEDLWRVWHGMDPLCGKEVA